ncbi:hypothetical protein C922_00152 [Plasmodium inui San Antonio 1]|uniref:Spatacsin C-terminal domain-containing protein n=1 Tax=Plasmodium inui San Antonio 1 TaxID=1237626 RepID=W7AKC7_9APIC|nr:hypothetical protein C922_00152 [Plasmodium inui San Antonio 1]EUD69289.1 hypothetical protein C922_00152 [Plasmodium inui San Antonio 1]
MDNLVCLKLLRSRRRCNQNEIDSILPNQCNDIVALLFFKRRSNSKDKGLNLCFNFFNSRNSAHFFLNSHTLNCFWICCDKETFTKGKSVQYQIPVLISQQPAVLNFYNFAHVIKINAHLENREIIIEGNSLQLHIYKKAHTHGKTSERNKLYNFYISYDRLFRFVVSLNEKLSFLESFNEKFVKIIPKGESSFFIVLNDIVCIKLIAKGLSLKVTKISSLQNILTNVSDYIYFQKCVYRTFFTDFEVSHDLSHVLLVDLSNQLWSFDLEMYHRLNLESGKNEGIFTKKKKIKNVEMYLLHTREEPFRYVEICQNGDEQNEFHSEQKEFIHFEQGKKKVKFNFESYFPDSFKLRQKWIYVNQACSRERDNNVISIWNYKNLENSRYAYILGEMKNRCGEKRNFYQSAHQGEPSEEKGKNSHRESYTKMLYFYEWEKRSTYYINVLNHFSEYDACSHDDLGSNGANVSGYERLETNSEESIGSYCIKMDYHLEKKYSIDENEQMYRNVASRRDGGVNRVGEIYAVRANMGILINGKPTDFYTYGEQPDRCGQKRGGYSYVEPCLPSNASTPHKPGDPNLEQSIRRLNQVLPKYIQHIHVYDHFTDVKKLFLIKRFLKWNNKRVDNLNKAKSKHSLYGKNVSRVKLHLCRKYFFAEYVLRPVEEEEGRQIERYLIVLKREGSQIKFLSTLKNYNYFYLSSKWHALIHVDDVLCKVLFTNYMHTLFSISAYNKREQTERILKMNNMKRHYHYFVMLYNGFLNKDMILIRKTLRIRSFKETVLLCRMLFHYIWSNFNMEIIYFYFFDYFSFINHVWKKRYKRKMNSFMSIVKHKRECIQIYMTLSLRKISDIVDVIGKKYLCFRESNEFERSKMQDGFGENAKGIQNGGTYALHNNKKKKKKTIQMNITFSKGKQTQRGNLKDSSEILSQQNGTSLIPQSNPLKGGTFADGHLAHPTSTKETRGEAELVEDPPKVNPRCNNSTQLKKSPAQEGNKPSRSTNLNSDIPPYGKRTKRVTDESRRRSSRRNIHSNDNSKDIKIFLIYYFEKLCFRDNYNLFLNKKYSIEMCSLTLHFIISFIDYFVKKKRSRGINFSKKNNAIFLELNKYIYFAKLLMNVLVSNYETRVEQTSRRNVSRGNVWEDLKSFQISNGRSHEPNFFSSLYLSVYNMYDSIGQILYVKKSASDKIGKLLQGDSTVDNARSGGKPNDQANGAAEGETTPPLKSKVDRKSSKWNDGESLPPDESFRTSNEGTSQMVGKPSTICAEGGSTKGRSVKKSEPSNSDRSKLIIGRSNLGIHETVQREYVSSNDKMDNAENIRNLIFYLCYAFIATTKRDKKGLPYFYVKDVLYREVDTSNKLLCNERPFDSVIYDILNSNDLSTVIYYIYTKKYEFFLNFLLLYFNYNLLHNFLQSNRDDFVRRFAYAAARVSVNSGDDQANSKVDPQGEKKPTRDMTTNQTAKQNTKQATKQTTKLKIKVKTNGQTKELKGEYNALFNKLLSAIINDSGITVTRGETHNCTTFIDYLFKGEGGNASLTGKENEGLIIRKNGAPSKETATSWNYTNGIHNGGCEPNREIGSTDKCSVKGNHNKDEVQRGKMNRLYGNPGMNSTCKRVIEELSMCSPHKMQFEENKHTLKNNILKIYKMYDTLNDSFTKLKNEIQVKNINTFLHFQNDIKRILKNNLVSVIMGIYKLVMEDKVECNSHFKQNVMNHLMSNAKIPFCFIHLNPHKMVINYYGTIIYRLLCNNIDSYLNVCVGILKVLCVDVLKFLKKIAINTLKKYIRNKLLLFLRKNGCTFSVADKRAIKFVAILELFYRNSSYVAEHNKAYTDYMLNRNVFNLYHSAAFLGALKKKLHRSGHNYVHDSIYKEKSPLRVFTLLNMFDASNLGNTDFVNHFDHASHLYVPFVIQNFSNTYYVPGERERRGEEATARERRDNKREISNAHLNGAKTTISHFSLIWINTKRRNTKKCHLVRMKRGYFIKMRHSGRMNNNLRHTRRDEVAIRRSNKRGQPIWGKKKKLNMHTNEYIKLYEHERCHATDLFFENLDRLSLQGSKQMIDIMSHIEGTHRDDIPRECGLPSGEQNEKGTKIAANEQVQFNSTMVNVARSQPTKDPSWEKKHSSKISSCYYTSRRGNNNVVTFNMAKNWMKLKGEEVDDLTIISYRNFSSNIISERSNILLSRKDSYRSCQEKGKGYYFHFDNYDNECYCFSCVGTQVKKGEDDGKREGNQMIQADYNYSNVDSVDDFVVHNNQTIETISEIAHKDRIAANETNLKSVYVNDTFVIEQREKTTPEDMFMQRIKSREKIHHACLKCEEKGEKSSGRLAHFEKSHKGKHPIGERSYRLTPCDFRSSGSYLCCSISMLKTLDRNIMIRIILQNRGMNFLYFLMKYFAKKGTQKWFSQRGTYFLEGDLTRVRNETGGKNIHHLKRSKRGRTLLPSSPAQEETLTDHRIVLKNAHVKFKADKEGRVGGEQPLLEDNPIYKRVLLKNKPGKKNKIEAKNLFYELIKLINIRSYNSRLFLHILEYYADNSDLSALFTLLQTLKHFSDNFFQTVHKSAEFNFYERIKIGKSIHRVGTKRGEEGKHHLRVHSKLAEKSHRSGQHLDEYEKSFLKIISYIQNEFRNECTPYIYSFVESVLEAHGIFLLNFDSLYNVKILHHSPGSESIHSVAPNEEPAKRNVLNDFPKVQSAVKSHLFRASRSKRCAENTNICYSMMVKLSRNLLCLNYISYENVGGKFNTDISVGKNSSLMQYRQKYLTSSRVNKLHKYILTYLLGNQSYTGIYFFVLMNSKLFRFPENCNYLVKELYKRKHRFFFFSRSSESHLRYLSCYIYSQLRNNLLALSLYNLADIFLHDWEEFSAKGETVKVVNVHKSSEKKGVQWSQFRAANEGSVPRKLPIDELHHEEAIFHAQKGRDSPICPRRDASYNVNKVANEHMQGEALGQSHHDDAEGTNSIVNSILRRDKDSIPFMSLHVLCFLNFKLFLCIFMFSNVDIFDLKKNKENSPTYVNIYFFKKLTKKFMPSMYEAYFGSKTFLKAKFKIRLEEEKGPNKDLFKLAIRNLAKYSENYLKVGKPRNALQQGGSHNKTGKGSHILCFENIPIVNKLCTSRWSRTDRKSNLIEAVSKMKKRTCSEKKIRHSVMQLEHCYDSFTYNKDLSLKQLLQQTVDETFFKTHFVPFSIFKNIFKREEDYPSLECMDEAASKGGDIKENLEGKAHSKKNQRVEAYRLFCSDSLAENKTLRGMYNYRTFFSDVRRGQKTDHYESYVAKIRGGDLKKGELKNEMRKSTFCYGQGKRYYDGTPEDPPQCGQNNCSPISKNRFYFLKHFDVKHFLISCQPLVAYHILIINHVQYRHRREGDLSKYLYINNFDTKGCNDYLLSSKVHLPLNLTEDLKNVISDLCLQLSIFYFNNNDILCSLLCFLHLCNVNIEKVKMYILSMKSIYYYFKKNYKRRAFFDKWVKNCMDLLKMDNYTLDDFRKQRKNIFYESFNLTGINYYDLFEKSFIELIVIKLFLDLFKEGEQTDVDCATPERANKWVTQNSISTSETLGLPCKKDEEGGTTVGVLIGDKYKTIETRMNMCNGRGKCDLSVLHRTDTDKLLPREENQPRGRNINRTNQSIAIPDKDDIALRGNMNEYHLEETQPGKQRNRAGVGADYYTSKPESKKMFILILLEKSIQYRIRDKKRKKKKKKYFNDFLNIISLYCKVNNVHQPLTLLHILSKKNDIFIFFYECIDKNIDIKTCQDIVNLYTKNKHTKRHILTFLNHVQQYMNTIMRCQAGDKAHNLEQQTAEAESVGGRDNCRDEILNNGSGYKSTNALLQKIQSVFTGNTHFYNRESDTIYAGKTILELLYDLIYNNYDYRRVQNAVEMVIRHNTFYTKFYIYLMAYVQFIFRSTFPHLFVDRCKRAVGVMSTQKHLNLSHLNKHEKTFGRKFYSYDDLHNFIALFKKKKAEYSNLMVMLKNVWFYLQIRGYLLYLKDMQLLNLEKLKFYHCVHNLGEYQVKRMDVFFDVMKKKETTYVLIFFLLTNGIYNLLDRFLYIFYFDKPIVCFCNFVRCVRECHFDLALHYLKKHYNKYIRRRCTNGNNLYYFFFMHLVNYLLMERPSTRHIILEMLVRTRQDCKYDFAFYAHNALVNVNLRKDIHFTILDACEELADRKKFERAQKMLIDIHASIEKTSSKYAFPYNKGHIALSRFVLTHYTCFKNFLFIIKEKHYVDDYLIALYNVSLSWGYSKVIFLTFLLNYSYTFQSNLSVYDQTTILLLCILITNMLRKESNQVCEKVSGKRKPIFLYVEEKILSTRKLLSRNSKGRRRKETEREKKKEKQNETEKEKCPSLSILNFLPLNNEECENLFLFKDYNENRKKYIKYHEDTFPNFEADNEHLQFRDELYYYEAKFFRNFERNVQIVKHLCVSKKTTNDLKLKVLYLLNLSTRDKISIQFKQLSIPRIKHILKKIRTQRNQNTVVHVHSVTKTRIPPCGVTTDRQLKRISQFCRKGEAPSDENVTNVNYVEGIQKGLLPKSTQGISLYGSNNMLTTRPTGELPNPHDPSTYCKKKEAIYSGSRDIILNQGKDIGKEKQKQNDSHDEKFIFREKSHKRLANHEDNITILVSIFICINNLINNFDVITAQRIVDKFSILSIYKEIKRGERMMLKKGTPSKESFRQNAKKSTNTRRSNLNCHVKREKGSTNIHRGEVSTSMESRSIFDVCLSDRNDEKWPPPYDPFRKIRNYTLFNKNEIDAKKNLETKLNMKNDKSHMHIDDIYKYVHYNSVYALVIYYCLCNGPRSGEDLTNLLSHKRGKRTSNLLQHLFERARKKCSCDIYAFILRAELLLTVKSRICGMSGLITRPVLHQSNGDPLLLTLYFYLLKNSVSLNGTKAFDASVGLKFTYLFKSKMNTLATNLLIYHNFILFLLSNFQKYCLRERLDKSRVTGSGNMAISLQRCTRERKKEKEHSTGHSHSENGVAKGNTAKNDTSKRRYTDRIFLYHECSHEFFSQYTNMILTNSCNWLYGRCYFRSLLDVYFYLLRVMIRNGRKGEGPRSRRKPGFYYRQGDIRKLMEGIKKGDPNFSNILCSNLIRFYRKECIVLPSEVEVEMLIFLYKLACKFTSERHTTYITNLIKMRRHMYLRRKKRHLIFRLLVNINEYDKLDFLFKLLFEDMSIFDFLKYNRNMFLSLNVYNFNCDLSVSLNSSCLLYNQTLCKLGPTRAGVNEYYRADRLSEEKAPGSGTQRVETVVNHSGDDVAPNRGIIRRRKNAQANVRSGGRSASNRANNRATNYASNHANNHASNHALQRSGKIKNEKVLHLLNAVHDLYREEKQEKKRAEQNQVNIFYNFKGLKFSDLINFYEENYVKTFEKSKMIPSASPFIFYDDHLFVYILSFYVVQYCKEFSKCDMEMLARVYKQVGLKHELYELLSREANSCVQSLKGNKDVFDLLHVRTIIVCINLLHHCALILLEMANLYEYHTNLNDIYLLILQLKYVYLHNKLHSQQRKSSNFLAYFDKCIAFNHLGRKKLYEDNFEKMFDHVVQENIPIGNYKINFLNLGLEDFISLVEQHPVFYETLILLKAYEKNYDDLVYAFIPKILYIQVILHGNKKYLRDYCSYSCVDNNTIKYVAKLFQINSIHLKFHKNFPTEKYKYLSAKNDVLTFDFSRYILSAINIQPTRAGEKETVWDYAHHVRSLKHILGETTNIDLKMKVCKSLGPDFDDLFCECRNILNLTMN